ncbi:hypothetical protein CTAYLR_007769 [Chrysophaeum taylorii]|uniref:KIF-binding protein n=1 Tax=Chrysophaeum taylorii TaxID=2483200 RepID=A0AAD7UKR4_9STRA|nr:hypothetical protein CTAYLR_007769 [Chrysophaeum taylorii]
MAVEEVSAQSEALEEASRLAKSPAPEAEPYKHLYAAREVLEKRREGLLGSTSEEGVRRKLVAQIETRLGEIALDVEEPHVAEGLLERALGVLAPGESADERARNALSDEQFAAEGARALARAALLWDGRDQTQRALELLLAAERICDEIATGELETSVLFYVAQAYGKLGDRALSAEYCRRTLLRQTSAMPEDWPRNAIGLAAYYVDAGRLASASGCAASALEVAPEDSDARADAHIMLGRVLLAALETPDWAEDNPLEPLLPRRQEPPLSPARTYEEARALFLRARRHFGSARERYVLDGCVTEHVGICRDESRLWAAMAKRDDDSRRVLAVCRRRAAILEPLRAALNPNVYCDLRSVLAYELGDIYAFALDVKDAGTQPSTSRAKLVGCGKLRDLAVAAYDDFLKCCVRDLEPLASKAPRKRGAIPVAELDADDLGPYLRASIYAARLTGQLFGEAGEDALERIKASLERYVKCRQMADDLFARRDLPPDFLKDELHLCDEMIALLPHKINQASHHHRDLSSSSTADETRLLS